MCVYSVLGHMKRTAAALRSRLSFRLMLILALGSGNRKALAGESSKLTSSRIDESFNAHQTQNLLPTPAITVLVASELKSETQPDCMSGWGDSNPPSRPSCQRQCQTTNEVEESKFSSCCVCTSKGRLSLALVEFESQRADGAWLPITTELWIWH